MKRREFITLLGGVTAWPLGAAAQQPSKLPTIGLLGAGARSGWTDWVAAFERRLRELGWVEGRTVTIEVRWAEGRIERYPEIASEFARLRVDVIVTGGSAVLAAKQATSTIPIVFAIAVDPLGSGLVASLARPGGNATGFSSFEYGTSAKWLELFKQIAPGVTRVAVLREPALASGIGQLASIQAVAPSFGVELRPVDTRDAGEIERAITAFAQDSNGGLIVTGSPETVARRKVVITMAARHRLPAVYPYPLFVADGGLIAYGPNAVDQFRRAAGYVDRILKGEKPGDLPVQAPTKYELVINLKTAKALGLQIPDKLLALANEMIE